MDFPNVGIPSAPNIPVLNLPISPVVKASSGFQFDIIKDYIETFQQSLDDNHDVGMMLTNFGSSVLMSVTEVGYEDPALMIFKGYVNGNMSTLIQHISQLNFLLTAVPKAPEIPKRRIGFTAGRDEE